MVSIHLLVIVHGMWGNPSHMAELKRIMLETKSKPSTDGTELRLVVPETNSDDSTYDGIDWGGERVAEEIFAEVQKVQDDGNTVTKFSITGYSLGGLVARYVVGILSQRGFFEKVIPENFNTIATPHLGLPTYPSFISRLAARLGPKLLSRTGEQFYCVDAWSTTKRPLLQVMADPEKIFFRGLKLFKSLRVYANAVNDRTVNYITASIELTDPFADHLTNGVEIQFDERYSPLIESYSLPDMPPTPIPKPVVLSRSWFKQLNRKSSLPPFLQFRFPLNIAFYALLPILIPIFLSLVTFRLGKAAHLSQGRIKLLEKESESTRDRLVHMITDFEHQVEDAVAEMIDDPGTTNTADEESMLFGGKDPLPIPILSPLQQDIAKSLNTLPIEKKLAFLDIGYNTHGTIISRDVQRFPAHRKGEGIIRHWADSFVL